MFYYVQNTNPVVGSVNENGKQAIKVYDHKTGNMRYLETDKDKVDSFVNNRNEKLNKINKTSAIISAIAAVGTGIIGAFAGKKLNLDKTTAAILGASTSLMTTLTGGMIALQKADKSITQNFIEENK